MNLQQRSNEHVRRDLGLRTRALRKSRGLNQGQLAERAGLSRPTISTFERGNDVSLDSFLSILRALDLLDGLALSVPEPEISPIAALANRAQSGSRPTAPGTSNWTWGDEASPTRDQQ